MMSSTHVKLKNGRGKCYCRRTENSPSFQPLKATIFFRAYIVRFHAHAFSLYMMKNNCVINISKIRTFHFKIRLLLFREIVDTTLLRYNLLLRFEDAWRILFLPTAWPFDNYLSTIKPFPPI
jgi:hypothetical protein